MPRRPCPPISSLNCGPLIPNEPRDTTGLTTENTELKLRLQGMEQQANLCDALKNEVDRLKIATGEIVMHTDAYGLGLHPLTYSQAPFFSHQSQHGQRELQAMKM
ncbi:Transcription factor RF2b [Glycine max]|nr:Transcription factor RF2b [Glycine max]